MFEIKFWLMSFFIYLHINRKKEVEFSYIWIFDDIWTIVIVQVLELYRFFTREEKKYIWHSIYWIGIIVLRKKYKVLSLLHTFTSIRNVILGSKSNLFGQVTSSSTTKIGKSDIVNYKRKSYCPSLSSSFCTRKHGWKLWDEKRDRTEPNRDICHLYGVQ